MLFFWFEVKNICRDYFFFFLKDISEIFSWLEIWNMVYYGFVVYKY